MSTIVTRAGKGSPLTNTEVDANFTNLNTDKVEKSGSTLTGDLAFGDNVKAKFGASDDLEIYHNGSSSYIADASGAGFINIRSNAVRLASADGSEILADFVQNGAVTLYYNNSVKLATTSSGVDITGTVVAEQLQIEGSTGPLINLYRSDVNALFGAIQFKDTTNTNENARIGWAANELRLQGTDKVSLITDDKTRLFVANSGDISFYEDTGTTAKLTWDASNEHLKFSDSVEARFGDNSEFRIYHDLYHTYLVNYTQGNLYIKQEVNDQDVIIQSDNGSGGSTSYFVADGSTGEAILYHYGSQKLATKSTGIDVTGTVTADVITETSNSVDYNVVSQYDIGTDPNEVPINALLGSMAYQDVEGVNVDLLTVNDNLGIGTTSPADVLHVDGGSSNVAARLDSTGTYTFLDFYNDSLNRVQIGNASDGDLIVRTNDVERFRITDTGNVGIGTTSPNSKLDVEVTSYSDGIYVTRSAATRLKLLGDGTIKWGASANQGDLTWDTGLTIIKAESGNDLTFKIGSSEAARIDSSGNVGIGRSSTLRQKLHIQDSSAGIELLSDTTGQSLIHFGDTNNFDTGAIIYDHSTDSFRFDTADIERMRITSSGSVGIGTTSTQGTLHVASTSPTILIDDTDSNKVLRLGAGSSYNYIQSGEDYVSNSASPLVFGTIFGATEWARFDTSGNLLVGTTDIASATNNVAGISLRKTGHVNFSRSNGVVAYMNRQTSDGTIVDFRKDGTPVGSIGTANSGDLYIGNDDTGLLFVGGSNAILPRNPNSPNSSQDATLDLGSSTNRFKDLYLSGGVYLGGVGADNLLDDYEEGTWTPVLTMTTSGDMTATANGANYTKVGRMVHFVVYFNGIDGTSPTPSGEFRLTGLPFTSIASSTFTAINVTFANILATANDIPYGGYVQSGNTYIKFTKGSTDLVTNSDIQAATARQLMVSGVYQTT